MLKFVQTKLNIMKDLLIIKETALTPKVNYNSALNCLEITGRSIPMEAEKFWSPVLSWYIRNSVIRHGLSISFNFDYLNSGSQQFILKLLKMMKESDYKGLVNIGKIIWNYENFDLDMLEMGQDFAFASGLTIEMMELEQTFLEAA